jgi:hypothetical protein
LSGKEPAISSSTASKFYGWDKTFKDILISYISGLQGILDTHNSTTSIVDGNLANWNATYNSSYHTLLTNAPNNTIADNLANWNATYNATYDSTTSTVNGNLMNWNATYNASYAKGGGSFSIENGTNVIAAGYSNNFTTVYSGSFVKLIAHSAETGSINVSFWNASNSNSYIDSVVISTGTDGNKTLSYAFGDETQIKYNVTSVTDIKQVSIGFKTTKS